MKGRMIALAVAGGLAAVVAAAALAGASGPGVSTGTATVFGVNPVQSLGNESLTDQKDADTAVPPSAYYHVTLTNLDGSGYLRGDYADVYSTTGNAAFSPTNTFDYTRHQDEFEQVMAYYWITEAQKYVQSLGFGTTYPGVDDKPQQVRMDQYGVDNSFETDHPKDEIRYGKGGVDDAEDAEVVLHEYGHALHNAQGFGFASEEAGAISEGFGDYLAVDVSDIVAQREGFPEKEPLPCVADWDSTSYTSGPTHCLRRVDEDMHYPGDLSGEVHHDGEIWSRALWDIRQSIGHSRADTVILLGSMNWKGTTMTDLANRTIAAASTVYGRRTADAVRAAFAARGIV